MRKYFVLFSILCIRFLSAQEINWVTMNEALEAQKQNPKKIFLAVYVPSCGVCKEMNETTFSDSKIINHLNANFYAVRFNAESTSVINYYGRTFGNTKKTKNQLHDFFHYLGLNGFPSTVFFDDKGKILTAMTGYMSAQELVPYLHFFKTDEYKKIKTAEDWEKIRNKLMNKGK